MSSLSEKDLEKMRGKYRLTLGQSGPSPVVWRNCEMGDALDTIDAMEEVTTGATMKQELVYQFTVTGKEINVISQALELFMRVGMGQLEEVGVWSPRGDVELLTYHLRQASMAATGFDSPYISFGIHAEEVKWQAKLARDLYRIIRHDLERGPNKGE